MADEVKVNYGVYNTAKGTKDKVYGIYIDWNKLTEEERINMVPFMWFGLILEEAKDNKDYKTYKELLWYKQEYIKRHKR